MATGCNVWTKLSTKAKVLALGLGWVVLVDAVLLRVWLWASWFFLVSAGLLVLLTQVVLGIYLY